MNHKILVAVALASLTATANAAVVNATYTSGYHNSPWLVDGSNGATLAPVYGDGALSGISPQNKCVDGIPGSVPVVPTTCASLSGGTYTTGSYPAVVVNGDNGTYMTNVGGATPVAVYAGSLQYDDALTFNYTDAVTLANETWFVVTGGTLAWTGTYGIEVTVPPSETSGRVGGSFFTYSFANGNVNLTTGARTSTSLCNLGIAGANIVGSLLCGFANPASTYQYSNTGTYVKPVNWTGVRDNGNGTIDLIMVGQRRAQTGSGNNLQERLTLSVIPVPAAVWLMGSALGLLGWMRRKPAAV